MPEIGVVQKPGLFEDLLRRLGVNRPTRPFTLDGNITPVVLVESGVQFVASPTPAYGITEVFTIGSVTVPAANLVMADTGPLPVGSYTLFLLLGATEISRWQFQWRDIPNTGSLYDTEIIAVADQYMTLSFRWLVENAGERFRLITAVVGNAGQTWQATIMAKL